MNKKDIGKVIKNGLIKSGMRQIDLAEMMGISRSVINQWVNGKSSPPAEKLIELIDILNIQDDIFSRKKEFKEKSKKQAEEELEAVKKDLMQLKSAVRKIADCINVDII